MDTPCTRLILECQAHWHPTFGSPVYRQYFIGKTISHSSGVRLKSMSTWWKVCLISFQMNLIPHQYHGIAFKSSWQAAILSPGCASLSWPYNQLPWDPGPSWSTPQPCGQHLKDVQGRPHLWSPPKKASVGVQVKLEVRYISSWSPSQT
jgi:hypothetical protein